MSAKQKLVPFLDTGALVLFTGYGLLSFFELNVAPATLVSVAAGFVVIRHLIERYPVSLPRTIVIPILIYLGVVALSAMLTPYPVRGSQVWSQADRIITLPIAFALCRERRHVHWLFGAVLCSALIASAYGVWQALHGSDRISSFFAHPVHFGEHLLMVCVFFLGLALTPPGLAGWTHTRRYLLAACGCGLLMLAAMMLNVTRAVWIGTAGALALHMLRWGRTLSRRFWLRFLIVLLVAGLAFGLTPSVAKRVQSIADTQYQSNTERVLMWESALQMIKDHPVWGVGADNYGDMYQNKYISPLAKEKHQRDAHQNYLSVAAQTGLVGLAAFVLMFVSILLYLYRAAQSSPEPCWPWAAFVMTVAFCIYGFMNSNYNTFWVVRLYFLLIGLTLAMDRISRRERPRPEPE